MRGEYCCIAGDACGACAGSEGYCYPALLPGFFSLTGVVVV